MKTKMRKRSFQEKQRRERQIAFEKKAIEEFVICTAEKPCTRRMAEQNRGHDDVNFNRITDGKVACSFCGGEWFK